MSRQWIFITYFILEQGDEEAAYETYRGRIRRLTALEGVSVISVSRGLRQDDKGTRWESLAAQYQIEHDGESPANHVLCKVLTSVELEETTDFEQVGEVLVMDDPYVPVDRYPSCVEAIEQFDPASPH